ncbi:MAG: ABC transporter substrate-binding protein [Christensenellales bacterium]
MRNKRSLQIVAGILTLLMVLGALGGCVQSKPVATSAPVATTAQTAAPQGTTAPAVKEVKIGFVWPLTGGSATIGQQHDDGARMAIEEINANGGIKSLGGAKIVPVVADSETKPDVGSNQVERLITKENVSIVVGCYNSAVTFPASEVAQRYSTPFLSQGGVKNEITERKYEWVFRINNKATYDVEEMLKAIDLCAGENKIEVKTYALIYESTDWGSNNAKIWKQYADKRGWTCVLDEPVTVGQSDMSSQVLKIKQANADLVNVSFYTPEQIVFNKAMTANKVNPPLGIWSVGGGAQDPAFFKALTPAEYEYMFVQEDWNVSMPYLYDWAAKLAEKVKAEKGYNINSFFAQGWTSAYVAYTALEAAGSTDKTAIKEAIKKLDIELSENNHVVLSGYPRIKFDENGQNTFSTGTIIQYQNGVQIAISPAKNRTPGYTAILPLPDDFATRGANSKPWGTAPEVK